MKSDRTFYFRISLFFVSGIISAGFLLELFNIKHFSLTFPYNLYFILLLIVILLAVKIFFSKTFFFKWFSSLENSLVVITAFALLVILSAFIPPQKTNVFFNKLHLNNIIASYPFIFTYIYLIFTLGLVVLRRINNNYSFRNFAFFFNHFGLWLILIGAGLGSADFVKLDMIVKLNKTVWYGYTDENEVRELPFAIELKEFQMKTYLPKLQLVKFDTLNDKFEVIKEWSIDTLKKRKNKYKHLEIEVLNYSNYAWFLNGDTVVQMEAPGYVNAAYIKVKSNQNLKESWVSNSSLMQKGKFLNINDNLYLMLSKPIPKEYASYVKVYTSKQEIYDTVIKVNKPINIMGWNVYQKDYNKDLGEYSDYSIFEVNKDPWLWIVYSGIILLIVGAIMLIFVNKNNYG